MNAWCPACGRRLSNVTNEGLGSCPAHGYVWGEPYAPTLVIDEEGDVREPVGIYMHTDEDVVAYRDAGGVTKHAPEDCVTVVSYNDWEGEW